VNELIATRALLDAEAEAVIAAAGEAIDFKFGTMIEIPRACWVADEIAKHAEFFSFGTNDLTQTTLGVSRDDAARFLVPYVEKEIYAKDPFEVLDRDGVGQLMRMGVERGRRTRPTL
jgi:pyruvate,orthophosphate dikinase